MEEKPTPAIHKGKPASDLMSTTVGEVEDMPMPEEESGDSEWEGLSLSGSAGKELDAFRGEGDDAAPGEQPRDDLGSDTEDEGPSQPQPTSGFSSSSLDGANILMELLPDVEEHAVEPEASCDEHVAADPSSDLSGAADPMRYVVGDLRSLFLHPSTIMHVLSIPNGFRPKCGRDLKGRVRRFGALPPGSWYKLCSDPACCA